MDEVQRRWFARQFNGLPEHVREWHELSLGQQVQARAMFSNHRMAAFVYLLHCSGNVLCRRNYNTGGGMGW